MQSLKHQAGLSRKWRVALRQSRRYLPAGLPALLFLTDPQRTPDPIAIVSMLPSDCGVIYRHFGAENRGRIAEDLARACARRHQKLLIAADPELAMHVGADGVHWPEARLGRSIRWSGQFKLQTASAHSRSAIRAAAGAAMDAVLVSTVFSSASPTASRPMGAIRLRNRSLHAPLPIYALGGLNSENASRVASLAGLSGVSLGVVS